MSLTALPANALAVPLSFAIMAVSMLSLSAGLFSAWLASIYNQTNWLLAKVLLASIHKRLHRFLARFSTLDSRSSFPTRGGGRVRFWCGGRTLD